MKITLKLRERKAHSVLGNDRIRKLLPVIASQSAIKLTMQSIALQSLIIKSLDVQSINQPRVRADELERIVRKDGAEGMCSL